MAVNRLGGQIEVSGVPDGVDEVALSCLLESKKKMGREISVVDVTFNRVRKAALVTLSPEGRRLVKTTSADVCLHV